MHALRSGGRGRLLLQAVASAVTALLLVASSAWGAGPSEVPASDKAADRASEATATANDKLDDVTPGAQASQAAKAGAGKAEAAKAGKAKSTAAKAKSKAAKAKGPKAQGQGIGNAHGKAVSAAAQGATPAGCRNHGHHVSSVAKGLTCATNPRPAR